MIVASHRLEMLENMKMSEKEQNMMVLNKTELSMMELSTKKEKSKLVTYHMLEKNMKEQNRKMTNMMAPSMKEKSKLVEQNTIGAWHHMMELNKRKVNTMAKNIPLVHARMNTKASNLIQQLYWLELPNRQ